MINLAHWINTLFTDPDQQRRLAGLTAFQDDATRTLKEHEMKLTELAESLAAVDEKLTKAKAEINARIDELNLALANVEIPADAATALAGLTATAQALDDIVPDAPVA